MSEYASCGTPFLSVKKIVGQSPIFQPHGLGSRTASSGWVPQRCFCVCCSARALAFPHLFDDVLVGWVGGCSCLCPRGSQGWCRPRVQSRPAACGPRDRPARRRACAHNQSVFLCHEMGACALGAAPSLEWCGCDRWRTQGRAWWVCTKARGAVMTLHILCNRWNKEREREGLGTEQLAWPVVLVGPHAETSCSGPK